MTRELTEREKALFDAAGVEPVIPPQPDVAADRESVLRVRRGDGGPVAEWHVRNLTAGELGKRGRALAIRQFFQGNRAFLRDADVRAPEVVDQLRSLTQQMNALIRHISLELDGVDTEE